MSFARIEVPHPKNGPLYRGLAVCRISTVHQDEKSLDDQLNLYHEWLRDNFGKKYDLRVISSQGSGEQLDRAEFMDLTEYVVSGEYDFVIAEDLGRIARRVQVLILCEAAEDSLTRVIAINDRVDTLDKDGWRQNACFATMRHESYNKDTSKRIQRSQRNRFQNGEMVRRLLAGYVKPAPGASEAECSKDPSAQPIYNEWFDRLEQGQSFQEIANWLNTINFPTGPASRNERWTGRAVAQTTFNPLLKGVREHNRRTSKRVNSTGRRKSESAAPEMLLTRIAPHLAFIESERYDRVIAMLKAKNQKYKKGIANAIEAGTRARGTRNDSRWPSQHLLCGVCGRNYVLGGHGDKNKMMCDGARQYRCWNAMTVDQSDLAKKVASEVHRQLAVLPDFDAELVSRVKNEVELLLQQRDVGLSQLETRKEKVERELANLTKSIAEGLNSPAIIARIQTSESELATIKRDIAQNVSRPISVVELPSAEEIRRLAYEELDALAFDSKAFARLMRRTIKDFFILPYRLIDGGGVEPRIRFAVDLGEFNKIKIPASLPSMVLTGRVDLTKPPQRVMYREQVIAMRKDGLKEREIAANLGITQTAVQRSAMLSRQMIKAGVSDPWQPVRSEAECIDYFKRIRHSRFEFQPILGFEIVSYD